MVTDTGGINDKSFNQSSWAGMQAAAAANPKDHGQVPAVDLHVGLRQEHQRVHQPEVRGHRHRRLPDGCATEAAAKANPKQKFAIVDCSYSSGA